MNPSRVLAILALGALLSGCSSLPRTHSEQYDIPTSKHTIGELCDSARQFFVTRAGSKALSMSAGVGNKSLTDEIGGGNGCFYEVADGSAWPYLGAVSLFRISVVGGSTLSEPPSTSENYPTNSLTMDGATVKVVTEPLPKGGDPTTTLLTVNLTAGIDGWEGQLHFRGTGSETTGDDQLTREGAQVLVNTIRTLKG